MSGGGVRGGLDRAGFCRGEEGKAVREGMMMGIRRLGGIFLDSALRVDLVDL
jgi:hypothetical protein